MRLLLSASALAAAVLLALAGCLSQPGLPAGQSGPTAQLNVDARAWRGMGRLAFVSRGAVYVLDGGGLRRVGSSGAEATPGGRRLAWSADGRWLAYLLDDGTGGAALWVAGADGGSPRRVVEGGVTDFGWSPGPDVLAVAEGGRGLRLVSPDGGGRQLSQAVAGSGTFAWSPDGTTLAFSELRPGRRDALYTVEAAGGPPREVPVRLEGDGGGDPAAADQGLLLASWWANGEGLLLWLDPSHSASLAADGLPLYSLSLDGGPARRLTESLPYSDWISWLPGGRWFTVVAGTGRAVWQGKSLAICDAVGGGCQPVPQHAGVVALDPAWSPDGSRVAFVQAASRGGTLGWASCTSPDSCRDAAATEAAARRTLSAWLHGRGLWLLDPTRATTRQLTAAGTGVYAPTWSADGSRLLYVADNAIWLLDPRRGRPQRIAAPLLADYAPFGYYGRFNWAGLIAWHG